MGRTEQTKFACRILTNRKNATGDDIGYRGMARFILGDIAGAQSDFAALAAASESKEVKELMSKWIQNISEDQPPFTVSWLRSGLKSEAREDAGQNWKLQARSTMCWCILTCPVCGPVKALCPLIVFLTAYV